MADYTGMTDEEVDAECLKAQADNLASADVDKLQIEWCKRHGAKWTKPDGTVMYEPPDWLGE